MKIPFSFPKIELTTNKTYLALTLFLGLLFLFSCSSSQTEKSFMNGLSYVASPDTLNQEDLKEVKNTHADAISLMPFAFMPALDKPDLVFEIEQQWWGESREGCQKTIQMAHEQNIDVMLKPQIWVRRGEFTGLIEMKNEQDWQKWEENYRKYILHFAQLAEEEKVEWFCIGTELARTIEKRPEFWAGLIKEVRKTFKGKLTYAENWDCFDRPAFLGELDAIGVDAYFPLSDKKNPSYRELKKAWTPHLEKMEECSEKFDKPILFTEWGYRNTSQAAIKPWDFSSSGTVERNDQLQARLYEVVFQEVFTQPFITGAFLWKWYPNIKEWNDESDTQFSPQGKVAEQTLREYLKGR